jgi:hypothetical protein
MCVCVCIYIYIYTYIQGVRLYIIEKQNAVFPSQYFNFAFLMSDTCFDSEGSSSGRKTLNMYLEKFHVLVYIV